MAQANSSSAATKLETIFQKIPKDVDKINVSSVGYHSECYRILTKHAER